MINKQNLWFLTLFSLILVLSVYYITMPNELLLTNNSANIDKSTTTTSTEAEKNDPVVSVEESEVIEALRVNLNEERAELKQSLESLLTNSTITTEEKNNAYNELQQLTKTTSNEALLESKLKEKYKLPVFVKIENKEITVVIDSDKHDSELANNIMRSVQEEFSDKVYITVQFK
ncbi:MAG: SpoIIIAH-like family protein [bacterium]|nr:SpoIIIAH-like family protein [bacterium]